MNNLESTDIKKPNHYLVELINEIQKELISQSKTFEQQDDTQKKLEWIKINANKFRVEFEKLWQEISQDANYNNFVDLLNKGDIESLKQILLPIIRERMKK